MRGRGKALTPYTRGMVREKLTEYGVQVEGIGEGSEVQYKGSHRYKREKEEKCGPIRQLPAACVKGKSVAGMTLTINLLQIPGCATQCTRISHGVLRTKQEWSYQI